MVIQMAWRNVWRNKIRSIIIIVAISLGLLAGVFILGLYDGVLLDRLHTVIHQEVGHLQLHHPHFREEYDKALTILGWKELTASIKQLPYVAAVGSRIIIHDGMVATSTRSSGVEIVGVYPEAEDTVSQLRQKLIIGNGFQVGKRNQALLGKKLAEKLKITTGDKIVLTFTDQEANLVAAAFRVAGLYQSDNATRDEQLLYVHADDVSRLMNLTDACHEVVVVLQHDDQLERAEHDLKVIAPQLVVENWRELSPETLMMMETTDTYSIVFIVIIMLALMFGIINTMLMAILERTREIGMLVALGVNKLRLFALVVAETTLLTLAGTPIGFGLAWAIISYFEQHGIDISSFASEAMSGFGFSSIVYPVFPITKLATVLLIVCLTAFVASLMPAYKALRLAPVEAMRH